MYWLHVERLGLVERWTRAQSGELGVGAVLWGVWVPVHDFGIVISQATGVNLLSLLLCLLLLLLVLLLLLLLLLLCLLLLLLCLLLLLLLLCLCLLLLLLCLLLCLLLLRSPARSLGFRPPRWPSGQDVRLESGRSRVRIPLAPGFFRGSSHTIDLKIVTPVATLPGAWCYRVSAGTGRPGVSMLWLGEMESLVCNFYVSMAARKIV